MMTIELLKGALDTLKKNGIIREGPMIIVRGSTLNAFLNEDRFRAERMYYGKSIAEMKEGGYATIRVATKSTRRKQEH
jgi:hypothetical protein